MRGAILAANDNDIAQFGRDTYSYMWPRDGALVAYALSSAGYGEISRRFFNFCLRTITPQGYMMHKYNPDGSVGSSWHPWAAPDGSRQHPIQEDETALVIWALWQHFEKYWDVEFMKPFYASFIKPAAQFMSLYRDLTTGLPGALLRPLGGAARRACPHGCNRVRRPAGRGELHGSLWRENLYRQVPPDSGRTQASGPRAYDQPGYRAVLAHGHPSPRRYSAGTAPTIDSATYALWYFGMLEPDDPLVIKMMETVRSGSG